jgi:hypothetical protein
MRGLSFDVELRAKIGLAWALLNLGDGNWWAYEKLLVRLKTRGAEDAERGQRSVVFTREGEREELRTAYLEGYREHESKLAAMGVRPFDQRMWEETCERLASLAAEGCGQSDVVWSRNISHSIHPWLEVVTGVHREQALAIATRYGYMSAQELSLMDEELALEGCCVHGLDANTCPCGCFEN